MLSLVYKVYASIPHWHHYNGIAVKVLPSVFHPAYFLSTKILLEQLLKNQIKNKSVLELGAGSGLISLAAAKQGAIVTATDINPAALASIKSSMAKNELDIRLILSDLFTNVPEEKFDYIVINPPYYPRSAKNYREMAFFCGPNYEYFEKLFFQLADYKTPNNTIMMILSDDCHIDVIKSIALTGNFELHEIHAVKKMGEVNHIYELQSHQHKNHQQ